MSVYCGDYTALCVTKFGDKIYVDTRDTSLAPHLMVQGEWEPWVSNQFRQSLAARPGAHVIDVGANFGWYTLLACRLGASHVTAFEPNPRLAALLRRTVSVNGLRQKVTVCQYAASDSAGRRRLVFDTYELGGGSLPQVTSPMLKSTEEVVLVETQRLDDGIVPGFALEPRPGLVIKIDVEGHELDVLRGAEKILKLRPVLFVEHHRDNARGLVELLGKEFTIRHVQHTGHAGAELSLEALLDVLDAETLLCEPRS